MENSSSRNRNINKNITLILFIILAIMSFFISVGNGAVKISPIDILKAIFHEKDTVNYQVIWNVRLPRTIVAGLVGVCFSLSGAILQGIMRNPLASPNIIGVSSGGGLAALIILILFLEYYYIIPAGAFIGALFVTLVIYSLAWKEGVRPTRLILAGVAISSILSAGKTTLIKMLTGLLKPTQGEIYIDECKVSRNNMETKKR